MSKYKSVLENNSPEYGSKAWRDMMEKKQALKTDTTLEGLLAVPARGAMALAAPFRGSAAPKSNTDIKNLIGRDVAKNERQAKVLAEIIKHTGRHPFFKSKAPPEILKKKEKAARIFARVKGEVGENTARSQLGGAGMAVDRAFNNDEYKKGGTVKKTASKASYRADGIAKKGKTKGRII